MEVGFLAVVILNSTCINFKYSLKFVLSNSVPLLETIFLGGYDDQNIFFKTVIGVIGFLSVIS